MREDPAKREWRRTSAFLRGWDDSLRAYYASTSEAMTDVWDYVSGWWACADMRREARIKGEASNA